MSDDLIISTKIAAISNEVAKLKAENAKLNAENAKLRAALKKIEVTLRRVNKENSNGYTFLDDDVENSLNQAREALKGMG